MKTHFVKAAMFSLSLGILFSNNLLAQYSTSPTNSTSSSSTTATSSTKQSEPKKASSSTHKMLTKNEWQKRYDEMKPKIEALSNKAKSETNADLTAAVSKLNKMGEDFKDKVDRIDNIASDKREAYENDLHAAHKALNEQYDKTKAMLSKTHPDKEASKAAPAQK